MSLSTGRTRTSRTSPVVPLSPIRPKQAEPPPGPDKPDIVFLKLPAEDVAIVVEAFPWIGRRGGRKNFATVIRALLHSHRSFFDATAPMRHALEGDMARLNIPTQYEYLRWLLGQRYQQLTAASEPERSR